MMRVLTIVLLALSGCQTIQLDRAGQLPLDAWTTDGGSALRERSGSVDVPPPLDIAWQYNAAAGFGPGSPLLVRDRLLVGTRKGELHSVDLESGRRVGYREFNEAIEGTPVIADGVLYVTSPWGNKALIAYDLDRASVKWRISGVPVEVSPIVSGDLVIVADVEATVRAYGTASGDEMWRKRFGERSAVHSTPLLLSGNRMFMATDRGLLVLLDTTTGTALWETMVDLPVLAGTASDGEHIYVPTTRGELLAIDAGTGRVVWQFDVGNPLVKLAAPAVRNGSLVFGATDGYVRRLNASTGALEWSQDAGAVVDAAPLWTNSAVYVGTMGRELMALDAETGDIGWRHLLEGRIKSAMAASDGALYVLTEPRYVIKFISRTEGDHAQD